MIPRSAASPKCGHLALRGAQPTVSLMLGVTTHCAAARRNGRECYVLMSWRAAANVANPKTRTNDKRRRKKTKQTG
jgi:hypothetical protein